MGEALPKERGWFHHGPEHGRAPLRALRFSRTAANACCLQAGGTSSSGGGSADCTRSANQAFQVARSPRVLRRTHTTEARQEITSSQQACQHQKVADQLQLLL